LKIIKDNTNTFPHRIWFEDGEIEALADKHRRGFFHLMGDTGSLTLQVDKFIEIYLPGALHTEITFDPFADFHDAGEPDTLGSTDFHADHLEVKIERLITQGAERSSWWGRYNTTVIHEAAHCILHPILFQHDPNQQSLFPPASSKKISCLQRTIDGYYTGEWWEYQANQFMANLLMPRELFLERFIKQRNAWHIHDNECLAGDHYELEDLARVVARVFGVSKQAAKLRLFELKQISNLQQEKLFEIGSLNFER
jgi:hypothetical protein